jgi:hypothetical protein
MINLNRELQQLTGGRVQVSNAYRRFFEPANSDFEFTKKFFSHLRDKVQILSKYDDKNEDKSFYLEKE